MGDDLLTSMSMLNSSIQNASNAYLTSKASKDDRKFAESMYQRQVEDARANWMMQNEYNSPAAQRDRMIDAQINPAIAWSKGLSADTGNSSEPDMATPLSWNKRIPAGLSQINPFEQLAAVLNAEKVKAEVQKLGADTKNIDKATEKTQLEIARGKFEYSLRELYADKELDANIKEKLSTVQKLYSDSLTTDRLGQLYYIQSLIEGENLDILKEKKPLLIQQLKEAINLTIEEIKTQKTIQVKNTADANKANKEAWAIGELTPKQKEKLDSDIQVAFGNRVKTALDNYFKANGLDNPVALTSLATLKTIGAFDEDNIVKVLSEQTGDSPDKIRKAIFGK